MSPRRRVIKRLASAFLPIALILIIAAAAVMIWIVQGITRPPRAPYLVTPQTFAIGPILNANDVSWPNHDGTKARGWLIKGAEGAPAVILLHRYGADRSWLLNLAVKLNETTNFTVLWPDLRGHGENPSVNWTLFGTVEGDDATAAIDYLRTLKTSAGKQQIGLVGIYGVELGAYAGLDAAKRYPEVRALVLDSVPGSPDDIVRAVTGHRAGMNNVVLQTLGRWGVRIYSLGKYQSTPSCELAKALRNERVLLMAGEQSDPWQASTLALEPCLSGGTVEVKKDLPLTGFNLVSATGEQEEAYDRPVIDFFDKALR
ncbi:MAG TPA: alpha/beta hydrolase [Pyrinomonadaceae bacterium]|nr:alpha/beta hydrolase [Pyrinomonadaceae bacterium]